MLQEVHLVLFTCTYLAGNKHQPSCGYIPGNGWNSLQVFMSNVGAQAWCAVPAATAAGNFVHGYGIRRIHKVTRPEKSVGMVYVAYARSYGQKSPNVNGQRKRLTGNAGQRKRQR